MPAAAWVALLLGSIEGLSLSGNQNLAIFDANISVGGDLVIALGGANTTGSTPLPSYRLIAYSNP